MEVAPGELTAGIRRFDLGAGTVQMTGARAPSQRMAMVPVVVAYLIELPTPTRARPPGPSCARLETGMQQLGHPLGPLAALGAVGKPP